MASRNEVDQWMKASAHPLKDVIEGVRQTVMGADKRVGECIKWKSPTFTHEGNLASGVNAAAVVQELAELQAFRRHRGHSRGRQS